jgi:lipoprotein-anchoring transpeptidase ErfK/SrfK
MPYFMRLNCSAIGMHSGHVTGSPASHGCIRLPYEKAQKFFGICRVGDEVQIVY